MEKEQFLALVKHNIIVSCQALPHEPLHGSAIMAKMGIAAKMGGAVAIRANGQADIIAIRQATALPTIGIIKEEYSGSDVYITPTLKEVKELIASGTEVIALDATNRSRPNGEKLIELIAYIKQNSACLIMGDISTAQEARTALELGCDFISTTLSGYTPYSRQLPTADFQLIEELVADQIEYIIAEGRITTPEDARRAYECGAHSIVVGGAITRPDTITQRFVAELAHLKQ